MVGAPLDGKVGKPSRQRPKQRSDTGRFREVTGVLVGCRRAFSGSRLLASHFHSPPYLYSTTLRFYTPVSNRSITKGQGGSISPFIFCSRALLAPSTTWPLKCESGSDTGQLKGHVKWKTQEWSSLSALSAVPFLYRLHMGLFLKIKNHFHYFISMNLS